MHFSVFSDAEWLYPDSAHSALSGIRLHLPRGGHDGAQLLGGILSGTLSAVLRWDGGPRACGAAVPVCSRWA